MVALLRMAPLLIGVWFAAAAEVRPVGVVTAVDPATRRITLKLDAGGEVAVVPQEGAKYVRVPPGETSLQKAVPVAPDAVALGDRVLARGTVAEDEKSVAATLVVVMTKTDLAKKQEAERAEWQRRGITGIVQSIDAAAGKIVVNERAPFRPGVVQAQKQVTLELSKATLRRYAPDSVKFTDTRPSTLAEIKIGDQVRALGRKNEDGTQLTAEALVSGTFRNLAVTVSAVDVAAGTLKVTDLDTKKPLTVVVNADTNLRKMPAFLAQLMAARANGTAPAGMGPGAGGPPTGTMPPGGAAPRQGGDFLERMPVFQLAELKAGDALILASTAGTDPARVTAITALAGVEPILSATPQSQRQMMLGSWNLEMNTNMGMQ